jgi:hypothetical protein
MVFGLVSASLLPARGAHKATFVAGGLFNGQVASLRQSGFDTAILWSLHVNASGQLTLNNDPLIYSNGSYNSAYWGQWAKDNMALLKTAPTSISRIEFSVGSAGAQDFEGIEHLVNTQGTGPTSTLYQNFAMLLEVFPHVDAINFDDESNYDVPTTTQFAVMLADLGYQVTFAPYTRRTTFWGPLYDAIVLQRPGAVDHVYLQCYAGGGFNNPAVWNGQFGSLVVEPGLWAGVTSGRDDPGEVQQAMDDWRTSAGIQGGFIWRLSYMSDGGYSPSDYAAAIDGVYFADFDDSAYYRVMNMHSGKALTVLDVNTAGNPASRADNGADIAQWDYTHGEDWFLWRIQDAGDGYQKLINKHSGKAMAVFGTTLNGVDPSATTENGSEIAQYAYNETQAWHQWRITQVGSSYKIVNKYSGKAAAVFASDTAGNPIARDANGADVAQWHYLGDDWYDWNILPVLNTNSVQDTTVFLNETGLHLLYRGLPLQPFLLQSATSLTSSNWVDEGTLILDGAGRAFFSEPMPTNDATYYRTVP